MKSSLTVWFPFPSLRIALAAIALAAAAAYFPILRADFIWDDAEYVTANPAVLEADGIIRIWFNPGEFTYYYPTTFSAFWLQCRLWGIHPLGYHLVNAILHVINTCLLILILGRVKAPFPVLCGLVFAIHPAQAASVAWVTELKNVLSEAFYLLALLTWLRGRSRFGLEYVASISLFLLGMLAKPVICSLPVVMCLLIWWKGEGPWKRTLLTTLPFFVISFGIALFTLLWESGRNTAVDSILLLSLGQKILLSSQTLAFYGWKSLWPHPLAGVYPRWDIAPSSPISWLLLLGITTVFLLLWGLRKRIGRGPLAALMGFAVTLGPILGIFGFSGLVYSYVFTHHLYHAIPFFALLFVGSLSWAARNLKWRFARIASASLLVLMVTAYIPLTWKQAVIHRNGQTFFEHNVAVFPAAPQPRVFLGNHFLGIGQYAAAIQHYEAAIRLAPLDAQAHFGMAEAFVKLGNADRVLEHLQKSVEGGPTYSAARFNLAWAYRNRGDHERAVEHFSELIRFRPSYWSAYIPLAESLLELGRVEEAEAALEAALEIRPGFADAEHRLALMLLERGEIDRAIEHFDASLALDPDRGFRTKPEFARRLVEKARSAQADGDQEKAASHLGQAKRIWPGLPELDSFENGP